MSDLAKQLRKTQTEAENKLWYFLRDRRFCYYKFRRQRPIGPYFVDFVCLKSRLIVELDGKQHLENIEYDGIRTKFLASLGFRTLRFWNEQVLYEVETVLKVIYGELTLSSPSSALRAPSQRCGRREIN